MAASNGPNKGVHAAARSGEWAQHFSNASCVLTVQRGTDRVRVERAVVVGLVERRRDGLDAVERQQRRVGDDHRDPDADDDHDNVAAFVQRRRVVRAAHDVHESVNIIIIIIVKFFNKKVVKCNFTNGKENGVQIIVNNDVYTKLLSRNVVRSDR